MNHLQIKNVDKMYDNIRALDSVTLNFEQNKIFSLVGVNGSGKSTLLRIIAGLEEPSNGNILFNNKKIDMPELHQISTLVFQKTVMFNTDVYNNISFGLKIRGLKKDDIERKVTQAMMSVGLENFHKRKAKKLSGGEQQRVALARALANNPSFLLADEPTGNLDSKSGEEIMKMIKELWNEGATIVLVTHEPVVAAYGQRILHIKDGQVEFEEKPSNLLKRLDLKTK